MRIFRWLFVVGGVAALGVLFFLGRTILFEKVEERVDRGFEGEAAINLFFALQELYRGLDLEVRGVVGIRRLPPAGQVLVLAAPRRHFGAVGVERLVRWVEEGGRLVVVPVGPWGEDPLLAALGVVRFGEQDADEDDDLSRSDFASARPRWPLLYAVEGREIVYSDGAADAAWILTVALGEGTATVVSNGVFLENSALAVKDHALIAWQLLRAGLAESAPVPEAVWVVFRDPKPSVWVVLTSRSRPMAISLAVLLLAAMSHVARRFGPLLEPEPREQRHLSEHVRAIGRFLWSVGSEDSLLRATREALARRLGHGLSAAALEGHIGDLAAAARLDQGALRKALAIRGTRDRQRFTHILQILESLRKST